MLGESKGNGQPLLWSAILILLLLSFLIPPLNIITGNLITLPLLVLYTTLSTKRFLFFYAVSLLILFAITASIGGEVLIVLALFFTPMAIVMGQLYKKRAPARQAVIGGSLMLLGELIAVLLLSTWSGIQPINEFRDMMTDSMDQMQHWVSGGLSPEFIAKGVSYAVMMIPFFLVAFSVYYACITHLLGRWCLRRAGFVAPALPPIRDWRWPKSLGVYYVIAIGLDLMLPGGDSTLMAVIVNVLPLLTLAFVVQAVSFLFYVAFARRWPKAVPIVLTLGLLIFPLGFYILGLIGLLDVLLPIRKRFTKPS